MTAEVEVDPPVDRVDTLNPLAIVDRAIKSGIDPDRLGRLIDLAESFKSARAKEEFALALNRVQSELQPLVKDTENSGCKALYILLETVQKAIVPVYTKHGFAISWSQGPEPREGMTRVLATLFHVGGHSKEYQGDYPIDGKGAKGGAVMNPLQGTVSAHTYAQRDMLRLMFNLTIAGVDTDGEKPVELVTTAQAAELDGLIKKHGVNLDRFLKWASEVRGCEIKTLSALPAVLMGAARLLIKSKETKE